MFDNNMNRRNLNQMIATFKYSEVLSEKAEQLYKRPFDENKGKDLQEELSVEMACTLELTDEKKNIVAKKVKTFCSALKIDLSLFKKENQYSFDKRGQIFITSILEMLNNYNLSNKDIIKTISQSELDNLESFYINALKEIDVPIEENISGFRDVVANIRGGKFPFLDDIMLSVTESLIYFFPEEHQEKQEEFIRDFRRKMEKDFRREIEEDLISELTQKGLKEMKKFLGETPLPQ